MKDLKPRSTIIRYERKTSGEIIHMDIKALRCFAKPGHRVTGRHTGTVHTPGAGWEYLHVAIDDHSRISFVRLMPDQTSRSAIAFLQAAIGYYQSLGVTVSGPMQLSIRHPWNVATGCRSGSTATTGTDLTAVSRTRHPSVDLA